eukprot:TRINITY_DN2078_c1_g1_i1.p1 TRINITY_DN2078_c1_g1~~TRINITY_DN2078_c1_g1_i1.p1  ORF type:complete len:1009 (+),score=338.19 TRINITY_DN2078_c1_g1_i1:106-3027(+)
MDDYLLPIRGATIQKMSNPKAKSKGTEKDEASDEELSDEDDALDFLSSAPKKGKKDDQSKDQEESKPINWNEAGGPNEPHVLSIDPPYSIPASINVKLRDYQRDGVKFLFDLYLKGVGGILADDMGLGKTLQTIAFICSILGTTGGRETIADPKDLPKPVLIVLPASVTTQWHREFAKWCRIRVDIFESKKKKGQLQNIRMGSTRVLLISYDTYRNNVDEISDIDWNCIIFDEVHKVKNSASKLTKILKTIKTQKRYGLTGTVMQNNFEELWTLLDFIIPNCLGTLAQFKEVYMNPILNGQRRDADKELIARGRVASKILSGKIRSHILRRDKSLIAASLPGKEEHIVFCSLTPIQTEIYKRVLKSPDFDYLRTIGEPCSCGSGQDAGKCCLSGEQTDNKRAKSLLLPCINRLTKIANNPALLRALNTGDSEKYQRDVDFEKLAFGPDAERIRNLINANKLEDICGKMLVLKSLLTMWKAKGSKVLVFSNSTRNMDFLERFFRTEKHSYLRLDGSIPQSQRQDLVDEFNQNKEIFIFCISTKAGGLGLNLVSANTVVIFDPNWNQTNDQQAQDRAYRIGQTKRTNVFRLISAGTIEEMIYHRQIYKTQMASVGVQGKNERRYFNGVQGQKGQEGELFGSANLFKFTDTVMTNDMLEKSKNAEKELRIEMMEKSADGAEKSSEAAIIFEDDYADVSEDAVEKEKRAIQELLKNSGVKASHLNTDIMNESEVENQLAAKVSRELEEQLRQEAEMQMRIEKENAEFFQTGTSSNFQLGNSGEISGKFPKFVQPQTQSEIINGLKLPGRFAQFNGVLTSLIDPVKPFAMEQEEKVEIVSPLERIKRKRAENSPQIPQKIQQKPLKFLPNVPNAPKAPSIPIAQSAATNGEESGEAKPDAMASNAPSVTPSDSIPSDGIPSSTPSDTSEKSKKVRPNLPNVPKPRVPNLPSQAQSSPNVARKSAPRLKSIMNSMAGFD